MKIALLQLNSTVGALEDNAKRIAEFARKAFDLGADLAIAPELILPGYPPRDLLLVSSFLPACARALSQLARAIPLDMPVLLGTVNGDPSVPWKTQNIAALLHRGAVRGQFAKTLLPTYDVFDERRYFTRNLHPSDNIFALEKHGQKIGVTICEDAWNDDHYWGDRRRYEQDPVCELVASGADVIVNVSASPFAAGKDARRKEMFSFMAARHRRPMLYCNAIGGNDGLIFDGASFAIDPNGHVIASAAHFKEDLLLVDLASHDLKSEPPTLPNIVPHTPTLHESLEHIGSIHQALVLGIADYFRKIAAKRAVIGLSGGIDSALVATLAVHALGASNVVGIGMPSPYSSEHSITDARDLAKRLGIAFDLVPISDAFAAYRSQLAPLLAAHPSPAGWKDLTEENLQSRIRGATLMAHSNHTGALVLTTGNKSECAVGYCTLYGDTCGGLAVIADLFKVEVYALARYINEQAEKQGRTPPIPESSITKPPSAELRPGQLDQDDLPPYEVLDPILHALIELELGVDDAAKRTQIDRALVASIAKRVRQNEYKRQQFAPTLRVSDRAWVGRQYPIAQKFFE